jgi:hypothetical protein
MYAYLEVEDRTFIAVPVWLSGGPLETGHVYEVKR